MIALKTSTGQRVRVSEDRVDYWEGRGLTRLDQPAPAKKATAKKSAKKATAKRTAKKSSKK